MIAEHQAVDLIGWGHALEVGAIVFAAGGGWVMLRQLRREVSRLWDKFEKLDKREQFNNTQTAIALTALATAANPHGNKSALEAVRKMTQRNRGNG